MSSKSAATCDPLVETLKQTFITGGATSKRTGKSLETYELNENKDSPTFDGTTQLMEVLRAGQTHEVDAF